MHPTYAWRRRLFHLLQAVGGLVAGGVVLWFLHAWWRTTEIPDAWPVWALLAVAGFLLLGAGSVSLVVVDLDDALHLHLDRVEARQRPPPTPGRLTPRPLTEAEQGLARLVAQDLSRLTGESASPPGDPR